MVKLENYVKSRGSCKFKISGAMFVFFSNLREMYVIYSKFYNI